MDASKVVVLQPGSSILYYGLMTHAEPMSEYNVVAYMLSEGTVAVEKKSNCSPPTASSWNKAASEVRDYLKKRWVRELAPKETINDAIQIESVQSHQRKMIVGKEALLLSQDAPYQYVFPMRRGHIDYNGLGHPLLRSNGPIHASREAIMQAQQNILQHVLERDLGIKGSNVKDFNVVLVVPDIFTWKDVKLYLNILLNSMGFRAAFVCVNSVSAAFGVGVPQCCVVDIGDQKIALSCVEDGTPYSYSKMHLSLGYCDIMKTLEAAQYEGKSIERLVNLSIPMEYMILNEFAVKYCDLSKSPTIAIGEIQMIIRNHEKKIQSSRKLSASDLCMRAPLALFYHKLSQDSVETDDLEWNSDPEDVCDDAYLVDVPSATAGTSDLQSGHTRKQRKRTGHFLPEIKAEAKRASEPPTKDRKKSMQDRDDFLDPFEKDPYISNQLLGLDQAILESIKGISRHETRRHMMKSILLVGGGAKIPGIFEFLQQRLNELSHATVESERVSFIQPPRGYDPRYVCWKGGCVLGSLEAASEAWVLAQDYKELGIRSVRERSLFHL